MVQYRIGAIFVDEGKDNRLILFGASGHAGHVVDLIEESADYEIVGVIDRDQSQKRVFGYEILGSDDDIEEVCLSEGVNKGVVAIGDNWTRKCVMKNTQSKLPSFSFVNIIHSTVRLGGKLKIGQGNVLSPGAVINNDVTLGDGCVVGSNAVIDHNSNIESYVSILVGSLLAGSVKVGTCTAIGMGSKIINDVTVGANVVVGASSLVLDDIADNSLAYGSPAKLVRCRQEDERYL